MHSPKEVMFLNELEEILDVIEPAEFQKVCAAFQFACWSVWCSRFRILIDLVVDKLIDGLFRD